MVKLIIWVVVGLLALSFFGVSLKNLVDSPTNQENVSFLGQLLQQGWTIFSAWLQGAIASVETVLHLPF